MNSDTLLILIIVFFLLGCNVNCTGMKENFPWNEDWDCNRTNVLKCQSASNCQTSDAVNECGKSDVRKWLTNKSIFSYNDDDDDDRELSWAPTRLNRGSVADIYNRQGGVPVYVNQVGTYAIGQTKQTPGLNCSSCNKFCCSPMCSGCGVPGEGMLEANCASACGGRIGGR